tara:strand:- start:1664 stop:2443 length:780 start_codon:yes stop_codon:yes gene_type:complete
MSHHVELPWEDDEFSSQTADNPYSVGLGDEGDAVGEGGHGSAGWAPSEQTLFGIRSGESLATGFGLEGSEYGMYFQTWNPWETQYAEAGLELTEAELRAQTEAKKGYGQDMYDTQMARIGEQKTEAGLDLDVSAGNIQTNLQSTWLDTSSQSTARTSQAGFTGRSKGREAFMRSETEYGTQMGEATRGYDKQISALTQTGTELGITKTYDDTIADMNYTYGVAGAQLDAAMTATREQKDYIDDIYDTLADLAQAQAWDD